MIMEYLEMVNNAIQCYRSAERSYHSCVNIMEQVGRAIGMDIPRTHIITHELSPSLVIWMRIPEFCPPEIVIGLAIFGLIALVTCVGVPLLLLLNFLYLSCVSLTCKRRNHTRQPDSVEEPYTSGLTQEVIPTLAANDAAAIADEAFVANAERQLERRIANRRGRRAVVV